jgi:hypothetical protein
MSFPLAQRSPASLDKLNDDEKKAIRLVGFKLQFIPVNPGLQTHRLANIKDKNV